MEKIKDISKVIIPDGSCLVEVIKPKRMIITPDGTDDQDAYMKVLVVGKEVKDIEIGDLCLKYAGGIYVFAANEGKPDEKDYAVLWRSGMNIVVKPDNFINPDVVVAKVTL